MSFTALQAMKAYGDAISTAKVGGGGAEGGAAKVDFGKMVQDAMGTIASDTGKAEQLTAASSVGQADLIDVVAAVNKAEMTLETVVAVRDEVIKAYQDILRMPI